MTFAIIGSTETDGFLMAHKLFLDFVRILCSLSDLELLDD